MTEQDLASDAPVRAPGTRTRSGNAMLRTRAALLGAAADCLQRTGLKKTTMGEIAAAGGVAKATLYNHFRTKDDVLAALVDSRVASLGEQAVGCAAEVGLSAALEQAALQLAADPALRRLSADEPAVLLPLTVPGEGRGWSLAREQVIAVLGAAGAPVGPDAVDLVLRLLVSQVLWPASPAQARTAAAAVAALLLPASAARPAVPGLGWPG